jgi:hypothetical protein
LTIAYCRRLVRCQSAREAALKREHDRLFPPGYWDEPEKTEAEIVAGKIEQMRRQIERLRDLADRGMNVRKYRREADKLEAQIEKEDDYERQRNQR